MATRRQFIKDACFGCMGLLASASILTMLEGCTTLSVYKGTLQQGKIEVAKNTFVEEEKLKLVRLSDLQFDILLVVIAPGQAHALQMVCTHIENPLVAHSRGLSCNVHGSTFDLEGAVTNGPADRPLKRYPVTETEAHYIINIA